MATANIYDFPNVQAHSPRNAFDMSFDTLFNSPAGMLLPAYVEDVKAGDKLKLSARNFTRTRAVNTAAFAGFTEKIDFFFVPYRLIWSGYNQWRLGNTQPRSTLSIRGLSSLDKLPHCSWNDFFAYNAETKEYSTYFSGSGLFNTTYFSFAMRMLDLLGYGLPPVDNITSVTNTSNAINQSLGKFFSNMSHNHLFNYFRLAAYQCIYMYAYRNETFEPLEPSYYNCDSLFLESRADSMGLIGVGNASYTSGLSNPHHLIPNFDDSQLSSAQKVAAQGQLTLKKLFEPRFKNWRKDIFSTIRYDGNFTSKFNPDANYPSTNVVVDNNTSFSFDDVSKPSGDTSNSGNDLYIPKIVSMVNMEDIRRLFAIDKFQRLSVYADRTYSGLYKAIFGIKVDEPDVPRFLGTFSSEVTINEVVATAAGSDGTSDASTSILGELAGKGIGSGKSFVFESDFNEDGIVMGIHYLMPYNYYANYKYNPFNVKVSKYDYYYPTFDGLGLSPVFAGERTFKVPSNGSYSTLIGYNTRYHEYKQRLNDVHGSFMPGQSDSHWSMTINDLPSSSYDIYIAKINPSVTDSIFGVKWNSSPATDPFMCFYSFDVTKVSNMEAIGVPTV